MIYVQFAVHDTRGKYVCLLKLYRGVDQMRTVWEDRSSDTEYPPLSLSFILSFVPFAKCTRFLPPFGPFIDVLCSFFFSLSLCFYIETGVKYVHKLYLVFSFFLVRSFTGSYLYILRHSIGSIYGATKTAERTTKQRKKELTHYIVQKEKHTIKKREVKRK